MNPAFFSKLLAGLKSKPDDRALVMKLARALGEVIGQGEPQALAEARCAIDGGLRDLLSTKVADDVTLLLELAASASMAIETKLDDEAVVGYIAQEPYATILPIIEEETLRLSTLADRSRLSADVITKAVGRLCEAYLAEGHGKPDPLVRITSRGCMALERLRAKQNTPPAA